MFSGIHRTSITHLDSIWVEGLSIRISPERIPSDNSASSCCSRVANDSGGLDINALDRFHDEFRIQLAWMRQSPPDTNPARSFTARLQQLKALLSEGIRSGEIQIDSPSTDVLSRCVIDALWMPESIVRAAGKRAALIHARDTVLRGVTDRGAKRSVGSVGSR